MLLFYLSLIDEYSDKELFEQLYNKHKAAMMACAVGILRNQDDAEDALQDAFLSIAKNFEKVESIKENERKYYFICVVRNAAYAIYNKDKRHPNIIDIDDCRDIVDDDSWQQFVTIENYNHVVEVIKSMKDIYRDALLLYLVYDMQAKDVAKALNENYETVKKRITRGKSLLAKALREEDLK